MLGDQNFPLKVRRFIQARGARVVIYPYVEATDEVLRERRHRFGEYMLFTNAVVEHEGCIVLIQQHFGEQMEGGQWMFPGGGVWPHEGITDAVVREVKEETGLDVKLLEVLGVIRTGRQAPGEGTIDAFLVTFAAQAVGGALQPLDTEEVAAIKLATVHEVESFIAEGIFSTRSPHYRASDIECFHRWTAGRDVRGST